jgi:hypothetical protein
LSGKKNVCLHYNLIGFYNDQALMWLGSSYIKIILASVDPVIIYQVANSKKDKRITFEKFNNTLQKDQS